LLQPLLRLPLQLHGPAVLQRPALGTLLPAKTRSQPAAVQPGRDVQRLLLRGLGFLQQLLLPLRLQLQALKLHRQEAASAALHLLPLKHLSQLPRQL
jgi:hypothetical protein